MTDFELTKIRVSVATYDRVIFPHPKDGTLTLALERKATVREDGSVRVRAQPFGGGVRLLDPGPLQEIVGEIEYDSERSKHEKDFRILIPPSTWEAVKEYCLHHLGNLDDPEIESTPQRELVEEFEETIHVALKSDQYTYQPAGFVIENNPVPTENIYACGYSTVRLYRIFDVQIVDVRLCEKLLTIAQGLSAQDLVRLALKEVQNGGRGRANSVLALPLDRVTHAYLALPSQMRFRKIIAEGHELDESVLAILGDIDVLEYQRVP